MIKAKMIVLRPLDTEFTMEITMTLGRWQEIMKQLDGDKWPSWELRAVVRQAIDKASASHTVEQDVST